MKKTRVILRSNNILSQLYAYVYPKLKVLKSVTCAVQDRKLKVFIFVFVSCTLIHNINAAPHPTTGFSILNQLQSGSVFSQLGFTLKNIPQAWTLQNIEQNDLIKKATLKNQTALLQLAVESVPKNTDLEKYVRRYLKDYHQFGFDLTKTTALKENNSSHTNKIILEIKQKNNRTSSLQIFSIHKTQVLSVTCLDQSDHFNKTKNDCQVILDNLAWIN